IRLAGQDGRVQEARIVGSDRQTNLTVLQVVDPPAGKPPQPLQLADARPPDGSLVMYLSTGDGTGHLGLWTGGGGGGGDHGVVVTVDGRVAGIARYGQFLSGSACRLIAGQIV